MSTQRARNNPPNFCLREISAMRANEDAIFKPKSIIHSFVHLFAGLFSECMIAWHRTSWFLIHSKWCVCYRCRRKKIVQNINKVECLALSIAVRPKGRTFIWLKSNYSHSQHKAQNKIHATISLDSSASKLKLWSIRNHFHCYSHPSTLFHSINSRFNAYIERTNLLYWLNGIHS